VADSRVGDTLHLWKSDCPTITEGTTKERHMTNDQSTWSPVREPVWTAGKGSSTLVEIVVFTDNRSEATTILEFAGLLAHENGSVLISVFIQPGLAFTAQESFAIGAGMIREVTEVHQSQIENIERRHRSQFDDVVRRHGIRGAEWRSLSDRTSEVAVHAYYADLVVIARPGHADQKDLAESLVLSSGRPIVLFPPSSTASRVRRVVVAWNATRESIRAVADALPLLSRAEAVEILIVDHQLRRGRHGEEPEADIALHLARHGVRVEVERLSSGGQDMGHFLPSQAAAFGADLLVMGAYGQSKLHEWVFGGITRTVLYEAQLPVLMSR
jgi:nucleotide-binding universal stress UspA family protein